MGTNTDGGVGGGVTSVKCERVVEGVLVSRVGVEKCLRGAVRKKQPRIRYCNDGRTRVANSLRGFLGEVGFSVAVLLSRLGEGDSGKGGMFSLFPSGFKSVNVLVVLIRFAVGVTSGLGRSRDQEGESVEDWDRFPSTEPCMACNGGERSASWVRLKDSCTGLGLSALFVHRWGRCRRRITRRR